MCEFCKDFKNKDKNFILNLNKTKMNFGLLGKASLSLEISQIDGDKEIAACLSFEEADVTEYATIEIKFCPMCGRKLTEV